MVNKVSSGQLFMGLVFSLTQSAFIGLGKLPDPMSGKIERNLEQASQTIDLLVALQEKTKGNLEAEEEKFLSSTIGDLRLNYVDEVNKSQSEETTKSEEKEKVSETSENKKETDKEKKPKKDNTDKKDKINHKES